MKNWKYKQRPTCLTDNINRKKTLKSEGGLGRSRGKEGREKQKREKKEKWRRFVSDKQSKGFERNGGQWKKEESKYVTYMYTFPMMTMTIMYI